MTRRIVSDSEEATQRLAREIAATLAPGALVALSGELGTGKTALVRGICEALGCGEQVSSPTFTIINEYTGTMRVAHCDLYRIGSAAEAFETGLGDFLGSDAVTLIEWAERAPTLLPFPRLEILCDYGDTEHERVFVLAQVADEATSLLLHHPDTEPAA